MLARGQGNLKFDSVSQSMRSCFPEYVISRRKTAGVHVVEDVPDESEPSAPSAGALTGFEDVELLLAEHGLTEDPDTSALGPDEEWEESEAAEVLAASWKSKRAELAKLPFEWRRRSRSARSASSATSWVTKSLCP